MIGVIKKDRLLIIPPLDDVIWVVWYYNACCSWHNLQIDVGGTKKVGCGNMRTIVYTTILIKCQVFRGNHQIFRMDI